MLHQCAQSVETMYGVDAATFILGHNRYISSQQRGIGNGILKVNLQGLFDWSIPSLRSTTKTSITSVDKIVEAIAVLPVSRLTYSSSNKAAVANMHGNVRV